jgi:dynein heavy chain
LQADLTKKRLERASKLTSALADEGVRWQQTADDIARRTQLLVGDVFVAAACIAYYGAFTGAYRQSLVAEWVEGCKARGIPVSSDTSLRSTLAAPVEVSVCCFLGPRALEGIGICIIWNGSARLG